MVYTSPRKLTWLTKQTILPHETIAFRVSFSYMHSLSFVVHASMIQFVDERPCESCSHGPQRRERACNYVNSRIRWIVGRACVSSGGSWSHTVNLTHSVDFSLVPRLMWEYHALMWHFAISSIIKQYKLILIEGHNTTVLYDNRTLHTTGITACCNQVIIPFM